MKKLHPVEIASIHPGMPDYPGHFILYLKEINGKRELQIIIGNTDAQFIALEKEELNTIRPLVHELLRNVLLIYKLELTHVEINKWEEGMFFAELVFKDKTRIDCRPSDAIVMALKNKIPILVTEEILSEIGYEEDVDQTSDHGVIVNGDNLLDALNRKLEEAIKTENYLEASKIRDKINEIEFELNKPIKKPRKKKIN